MLKKQDSLQKAKASQRSRVVQEEDDSLQSEQLSDEDIVADFVNRNYKKNPMYKGEPIKKGDFEGLESQVSHELDAPPTKPVVNQSEKPPMFNQKEPGSNDIRELKEMQVKIQKQLSDMKQIFLAKFGQLE